MGSEARARLGLAALLGVTMISFAQVFAQGDYPGPILLGMAIAAGIAILMRRLGSGIPLTLLASAAGLVWYLSLVFQAPHTFYGLPTVAALRGLGASVRYAYDKSYIDFAPVPVRPGYVILTIVALWSAATVGEIATFRLRRPLVASLIPMALFTLLLIVGTGAGAQFFVVVFLAALLTYWAAESAHRLRSWGRWMSTWSHRKGESPTSIAGGIARKMGASCVAAAIVAPVFLPVLGHGGISWRNGAGAGPGGASGGGSVSGEVDLLASITPAQIQQSHETLFTVDAPQAEYWRLASLSRFDGKTWSTGSASREGVGANGAIEPDFLPSKARKTIRQRYEIDALRGTHLPAAAEPIEIEYARDNELRINPETGDIEVTPNVAGGSRYSVTSAVSSADYSDLVDARLGNPGGGFSVAPEVSTEVRDLLHAWTDDADTPFKKLIAIQTHLRQFHYSLRVKPGTSTDYLTEFLTTTREGYCQQFATAFAVLSRLLRYPTRVSIGFLPGTPDTTNPTHYTITGSDTHAWPEVYFEDYGWIRFEPTPRGEAEAPAYTTDLTGLGTGANGGGGKRGGGGGHNFADGNFANPFLRGNQNTDAPAPGGPRDTSPAWRPAFARLLAATLSLVVLWLLLVPALKAGRVRARYRRARGPRDEVAAAFLEFHDDATELAVPKRGAESPSAFAERVASLGIAPRGATLRLARLYEAAEYSIAEVTPAQAAEARRLARQLRGSMWRAASLVQKATRLFSARTLVRARMRRPLVERFRQAAART